MDVPHFTHEETQMNRKGQQIFKQLEVLNLITEEKSCREASCQTGFTLNAGNHVKVPKNFQYPLIIINLDLKNVWIIYMIPKTLWHENIVLKLSRTCGASGHGRLYLSQLPRL